MTMARSCFPWPGNKEKLVPYIIPMIPPGISRCIEAFGGSGALTMAMKPKKGRLDILNDLDNDIFNVYCCLKETSVALMKELKFLPNQGRAAYRFWEGMLDHQEDFFKHIKEEKELLRQGVYLTEEQFRELERILEGRAQLFDVQRAAAFLLIRYSSYNGLCSSVGVRIIDVCKIIERLEGIVERMETVFLENQDALALIREQKDPNGALYADPPYWKAEEFYKVSFKEAHHVQLRDMLIRYPGYSILSYNNVQAIIELYRDDFFIFGLIRDHGLAKTKGAIYKELIITNYDARPFLDRQMDLFNPDAGRKWEVIPLSVPQNILKT